ncbi:MAG TPA: AMP-binding protein [Acidimicrobiales bacterium]|jgi:fatty-acyl-CoA synthase|nr:AMP-binding protein [Acidimicrobiales bacterium]
MVLERAYWERVEPEPVIETTVGGLLRAAAAATPNRTALVAGVPEPDQRRRWSFAEVLAEAERAARSLLTQFEPGEHVAVWAPNLPEWVLLEMAAGLAGLVLVTVNPAFRPGELEFVLRQSRAAGIFYVPEFRTNQMAAALSEVRGNLPELRETVSFADWKAYLELGDDAEPLPEVRPDALAQIQYTSGTTGFPKGACLHHRGIVNNARFTADLFEVREGDVWLNPMPLFHTGGCVLGALGALHARATQIPVLAFDAGLVLELIESEGASVMGGVPTMLIAMTEHPDFARRDLGSLRSVLSGGSTVPAPLVRQLESSLHIRFGIVFGQTEASPVITQTRLSDTPEDKAETIGQPHPHQDVKVIDPATGVVIGIGEVGEICCRGYNVMLGYFELPEATRDAIDADGWLHTGDLGSMDGRGYLTIEGRLRDMVIRGGENLYPREIENLLLTHPGVAEVAVIGVPDARWGEELAAVVRRAVGQPDASGDELHGYVRERLAPQKAPRIWAFVDTFPLTPSGKIQKYVLRDRIEAGELPLST